MNDMTHEKSTADPNAIRDQDRAEREQQARQLGRDPVTNALGNEADVQASQPGKADDEAAWQRQQDDSKKSSSSHKK